MLSKSQVKDIRSLHRKKERDARGLFLAEGIHTVEELFASPLRVRQVVITAALAHASPALGAFPHITQVPSRQMEQISALKTPPGILAVVEKPQHPLPPDTRKPVMLLDHLQDPGNTGTILRTAHWFGITQVVCSQNSTDPFSPKTIQATMGSIAHVKVYIASLEEFMQQHQDHYFFAGLHMTGVPIHKEMPPQKPIALVVGSEVDGLSEPVQRLCHRLIHIPPANPQHKPESLNASIAAGIAAYSITIGCGD